VKCGNTFLLYDDDYPKPHLHVVITDPDQSDCVVLVSITTERDRSDTMTRLAAGCHPFINLPSVITYNYSKLLPCTQIKNMIASGDATAKEDASETIVRRAQAGLLETTRAPQEVKEFFLEWWAQNGVPDSN